MPNTIAPLDPMVALGYFFIQQERSILALDECEDKTLQLIYSIAYNMFSKQRAEDEEKRGVIVDTCEKISKQFEKILKCATSDSPEAREKLIQYAKHGIQFGESRKRKYLEESDKVPVTPMEDEPESADLHFVRKFKEKTTGRMNWKDCYHQGRQEGLFDRFGSHLSLKNAFNKRSL